MAESSYLAQNSFSKKQKQDKCNFALILTWVEVMRWNFCSNVPLIYQIISFRYLIKIRLLIFEVDNKRVCWGRWRASAPREDDACFQFQIEVWFLFSSQKFPDFLVWNCSSLGWFSWAGVWGGSENKSLNISDKARNCMRCLWQVSWRAIRSWRAQEVAGLGGRGSWSKLGHVQPTCLVRTNSYIYALNSGSWHGCHYVFGGGK